LNRKQEKFSNKIRKTDPVTPDPDAIVQAAQLIRKGGVVLFPTRCLYGLGADAMNPDAVNRIFEIKQRPKQKPILVLIHDQKELGRLVQEIPPAARRIMDGFWPGKVTLVFKAKADLPVALTAGTGKIGVRLCGHPVAAALAREAGCPITGTSANLSDHAGCSEISELDIQVAEKVDLILDAGPLEGGKGSTVVDVTEYPPIILREGAVRSAEMPIL
jgi:L-threonylcarbamoyladenylate synthase